MLLALAFVPFLLTRSQLQTPSIAELSALAKARDVAKLATYLDERGDSNPFAVLKTGGPYEVGKFGWKALPLDEPGGKRAFVVFSTPLTSEDIGELLFERNPNGLHWIPEDDSLGVTPVRHDFDIRFGLQTHEAFLSDRFTLESSKGGFGIFRMGPQYRVDTIDGKKNFNQSGGIVALSLPKGRSTLDIRYRAVVNQPRYAASVTSDEATLTNDYWYPMIARWPAAFDETIHVPKGWMAVGQGELTSQAPEPTGSVWKYRMDLPVVYYSLTAGPFQAYTQKLNGRNYSVWSSAMTPVQKTIQTEFYQPIIEFYSSNFGPFPFSGYGAVVSPSYGGGALEAYSFATYGTGWLPAEDAHEPSHTWWGGIIPNTYLHSFWNESFANYSEGLFARSVPIGNQADRALAFIRHPEVGPAWDAAPMNKAGADIGPAADALGYGKGSYVLAALEDELGTKTMIMAMRHWIDIHPKGTPGEWEGFEAAVHGVTSSFTDAPDYTWFFDQWLRRPGFARFTVDRPTYSAGTLAIPFHFVGSTYRMRVEVLVQVADGSEQLLSGEVSSEANPVLRLPLAEQPVLVSIDPYRRLLRPFSKDEAPLTIGLARGQFTKYTESGYESVMAKNGKSFADIPKDLNGVAICGMPGASPLIQQLCAQAGFSVAGTEVTFRGQTVDTLHGAAVALIELAGGRYCALLLGKPQIGPNTGDAQVALTDDLGRFVAGTTAPKRSGGLVFALP